MSKIKTFPMETFLDLPQCVSAQVISDWLSTSDIAKLDSATCSKRYRPEFLQLLTSENVLLPNTSDEVESHKVGLLFDWLAVRQIKVTKIALPRNIENQLLENSASCRSFRWKSENG